MQSLKEDQDIVFKRVDKGDEWIIIDKHYYRDKTIKEQLLFDVYKEISVESYENLLENLKEHAKKYEPIITKNKQII